MNYKKTVLREQLRVDDVVSVHYFEYPVDFSFGGEAHDFWEFVYADKNDLVITTDDRELDLPQGGMFLHKPMEYHNIRGNGVSAPNSVIVSFSCSSPELYEIAGKVLGCGEREKILLATIVEETVDNFSSPLGDPYLEALVRRQKGTFGGEQLIRMSIETLLISLIRRYRMDGAHPEVEREHVRRKKEEMRLRQICDYFKEHINDELNSKEIQKIFFISESSLQKLFQNRVGCGAVQYFQRMKIERAKEMIRENRYNFSEIAEQLSFSSIHYFSRRFKAITGMTPSQYAASVKSITVYRG